MFVVPMDARHQAHALGLMSDDINQVFYDDVRVPASALVGVENNGWGLITSQLNRSVTLCSSGIIGALTDTPVELETKLATAGVIDQGGAGAPGPFHARLEFLRLASRKRDATQKRLVVAGAPTIKVFGTEFYRGVPPDVRGDRSGISTGRAGVAETASSGTAT
jgi:hypothetical protein